MRNMRSLRSIFLLILFALPFGFGKSQLKNNPAWNIRDFPQPGTQECRSTSNRLCDPDGILIDVERQRLVKRVEELEVQTKIECSSAKVNVQMAIVLINRMDMIGSCSGQNREEKAAEAFAVLLHNQWGVGSTTECGGTGILVFFSIRDRAFFVSRGKALEGSLTDKRIDRVMDTIKPWLRDEDYARALTKLVDELDKYLSKGPPSREELRNDMLENFIPLSFFILILGVVGFKSRNDRRDARAYAQVETQLSQLDRDRAQALQGRYECTSCPICLENFETTPEGGGPVNKGSDGLPLKLLRCGHVFDETCWSEWVSSGTGNVRRCPICQQDVAGPSTAEPPPAVHQQRVADDNRVFRQYNRERNFRLLRLGLQYPRYVRQDQIQRWTDTTYEGSLARDPGFVRNNPQHAANNRSGGSGRSGGSSFGGGSSGGGRGGSW